MTRCGIPEKIFSCILFCLPLALVFSAVEASLNDEVQALLAFRRSITRDPFEIFKTWNENDLTPCNWTGISCDSNNTVVRVFLPNFNLSGSLSPELRRLKHLRTLSVSDNSLTGLIPFQLSEIESLWKLNLSHNQFTGKIPAEFGALSSLRILDLSRNRLQGQVPAELFENCNRLRYVAMAKNNLSGQIPTSLGSCSLLVGFDFSVNTLQGNIPEELSQLPFLAYISLSVNKLTGVIPMFLSNCTSLQYVDLSKNLFYGDIPLSLATLSYMQYMNLSFNRLSGPVLVLHNCSSLHVLDVSSNILTGALPNDLVACSQLSFLNLSSNLLSGTIPSQLGILLGARELDFSNNRLSGSIPPELGNLRSLSILRLGMNPIQGSIPPDIGNIELLQILDLQKMHLQGVIPPALSNCRFLLELDLSNNQLIGNIPETLTNMTYLRVLNLENNSLSGSIPSVLGSLQHVAFLDLSHNLLTGKIPSSLGNLMELAVFDVSFNMLSGPIPRNGALQRFNMSSFMGNAGLCGLPVTNSCSPLPFATPPPHLKMIHTLSTSAIIAIVAAAVIAAGVAIITVMNIRALQRRQDHQMLVYESTPPSPESGLIIGKLVLFSKSMPSKYEDWEAGTKALLDKDCIVGSGPLGTVYKTTLEGGLSLAVKNLDTLGRIKNQDEFEQDMSLLGNLRHKNIVLLQGYFWSSTMQLLLSDFITNGSLFSHLHERRAGQKPLDWTKRFKIALGTARGLAYLHHDCKPGIIHFNIKSTNILLNDEFEPHLADYGLAKLLPILDNYISTRKIHTAMGYIAPELACQSLRLNEKCDVYSYGVILLELATGRKPVENAETDVVVLCEYVRSVLEEGRGMSCIDMQLQSSPESEIMQFLKLGLICTSQTPSKRPSMAEAVQILESIKPNNDVQGL